MIFQEAIILFTSVRVGAWQTIFLVIAILQDEIQNEMNVPEERCVMIGLQKYFQFDRPHFVSSCKKNVNIYFLFVKKSKS